MKQYLFDTNAVLRFVLNDIPNQSKVIVDLVQQAKQGVVLIQIPTIVFFELTYALIGAYKLGRQDVWEQCTKLLLIPYLEIPDRQLLRSGYDIWVKEQGVSFADAIFSQIAEIEGYELVTFDKKLKKIIENKI